jgi:thiol:disulfide interchange protein
VAGKQRLVDESRTTLPYGGQWLKNSRELLGLFLLAAGTVGVVVCLAALAHQETKSAIAAGIAAGLALTGGTVWLVAEDRRIRRIGAEPQDDDDPMRRSGFPLE